MNIYKVKTLILLAIIMVVVSAGIFPLAAFSKDNDCVSCHDDIWDATTGKKYIHPPFAEKRCERCHAQKDAPANIGAGGEDLTHGVKWVGRHFTAAKSHWFDFKTNAGEDTVVIEAKGEGGRQSFHEYDLPALDDLAESQENEHDPPKISNVRVLEVRRGIFFTATIGWDTDKPATSSVAYGLKNININSPFDSQMARNHLVTLTSIKPKKVYQYSVSSEDRFGNRSDSAVYTFSTETIFSETNIASSRRRGLGEDEDIQIEIKYYRYGNKYSINVIPSQEVTLALGVKLRNVIDRRAGGMEVMKHILTNNEVVTNLGICYSCHREYKEILTHPINVYPKRGMVIPPEYPTLSDGRITCMSCHEKHASNLQDRMIKPYKKDLCVGCHKDML
ncbi:MAG: cytochrome c3 family protein [Proteobacteria bacterium]|nr:cytochrome c3 family protein [Pseudomonadota bacterium]MBU1688458.1 cytochrome c3 family protein [Pseudomonadota bacterium]